MRIKSFSSHLESKSFGKDVLDKIMNVVLWGEDPDIDDQLIEDIDIFFGQGTFNLIGDFIDTEVSDFSDIFDYIDYEYLKDRLEDINDLDVPDYRLYLGSSMVLSSKPNLGTLLDFTQNDYDVHYISLPKDKKFVNNWKSSVQKNKVRIMNHPNPFFDSPYSTISISLGLNKYDISSHNSLIYSPNSVWVILIL